MKPVNISALLVAGVVAAAPAHAQLFHLGIRGGVANPSGTFADSARANSAERYVSGAAPGFAYGLDAGLALGAIGLYAAVERIEFRCQKSACDTSGKYRLSGASGGVRFGIPLFPVIKPWVKAGITINELEGRLDRSASEIEVTTKRTPGYEVGAGVDFPLLGLLSITPQVRYVGQKLEYRLPFSSSQSGGERSANYYTIDIGLRLRSPL